MAQRHTAHTMLPPETAETLEEFAAGVDGAAAPSMETVALGRRLTGAACTASAPGFELAVDDDGALSFDFRLKSGVLVMAELSATGTLDASAYGSGAKRIRRLPRATEAEFMALLRELQ